MPVAEHSVLDYRPLNDQIVVDVGEPADEVTAAGIILPPPKEEPRQSIGTVIAVGPGVYDEQTGARIPLDVKVGDRIAFSKYGHIKHGTLRILREPSVHYVLDPT